MKYVDLYLEEIFISIIGWIKGIYYVVLRFYVINEFVFLVILE